MAGSPRRAPRGAMLNQFGWRLETDRQRLFGYAAALAPEKKFFLRKAIGRTLCDFELWDGDAVRTFVAAPEHVLSPLFQREALEHP